VQHRANLVPSLIATRGSQIVAGKWPRLRRGLWDSARVSPPMGRGIGRTGDQLSLVRRSEARRSRANVALAMRLYHPDCLHLDGIGLDAVRQLCGALQDRLS
jgi:hypothetical protein